MKKLLSIVFLAVIYTTAAAQEVKAPENWFNLDPETDNVRGISTEKAYNELLKDKKSKKKIIVAIIDSGVDIEHEDLKDDIWVNKGEIAGNGKDDDGNGYIDDINGWNFIGNANGEMVNQDNLELTRLYAKGKKKYENTDIEKLKGKAKKEYDAYLSIKETFENKYNEEEGTYASVKTIAMMVKNADAKLKEHFGKDDYTKAEVVSLETEDEELGQAQKLMMLSYAQGFTVSDLDEALEYFEERVEYNLNPDFDPRNIVGDDYSNVYEKYYGNNIVEGPDAVHGTHVAGIVGANRTNALGMKGVANNVEFMIIRTVPNGDERDKDVANSIIYAVDNGAQVINMSFGKAYSPEKKAVDKAVKYAEKKGVLLIHAAGNDSKNNDEEDNFPDKRYLKKKACSTWIEVGASSWKDEFIADFSNYGQKNVDVFAPGVDIYSSVPQSEYREQNGTSMAAPVVAGLAALIWSYYPDFSAVQIKEIILKSVVTYPNQKVLLPGSEENSVYFKTLSNTGGIVNAYNALKLAEEMSK